LYTVFFCSIAFCQGHLFDFTCQIPGTSIPSFIIQKFPFAYVIIQTSLKTIQRAFIFIYYTDIISWNQDIIEKTNKMIFLCLSILYLIFYDVNDCLINYKSLKMSYGNVPPPESISKFGRRWGDEQARLANSEKEKQVLSHWMEENNYLFLIILQYNELVKGGKSAKGGEDVDDE